MVIFCSSIRLVFLFLILFGWMFVCSNIIGLCVVCVVVGLNVLFVLVIIVIIGCFFGVVLKCISFSLFGVVFCRCCR